MTGVLRCVQCGDLLPGELPGEGVTVCPFGGANVGLCTPARRRGVTARPEPPVRRSAVAEALRASADRE